MQRVYLTQLHVMLKTFLKVLQHCTLHLQVRWMVVAITRSQSSRLALEVQEYSLQTKISSFIFLKLFTFADVRPVLQSRSSSLPAIPVIVSTAA